MLNDVIKIRDNPGFTHWKNADRIAEAFVISFKLAFSQDKLSLKIQKAPTLLRQSIFTYVSIITLKFDLSIL